MNIKFNPFSDSFLCNIHKRIKSIIKLGLTECDCVDIYLKLLVFIEEDLIYPIAVTDILFKKYPKKLSFANQKIGLIGLSGIGIRLLKEKSFMKSFTYSIIDK